LSYQSSSLADVYVYWPWVDVDGFSNILLDLRLFLKSHMLVSWTYF